MFSSMLTVPGSPRMHLSLISHAYRLMHKYYWNIYCTCYRTYQPILILTIFFQEVKLQYGKFDKNRSVDLDDMDEKAVVYELFHSIVREVRDEVSAGCMIAFDCKLIYIYGHIFVISLFFCLGKPNLKCTVLCLFKDSLLAGLLATTPKNSENKTQRLYFSKAFLMDLYNLWRGNYTKGHLMRGQFACQNPINVINLKGKLCQ